MKLLINRSQLRQQFTQLPNSIPQGGEVNAEGMALLWFALSQPPEREMKLLPTLRDRFGWGRDKTYKHIQELVALRYILVVRKRRESGQLDTTYYEVYDQPQPHPENQEVADFQVTDCKGKPAQLLPSEGAEGGSDVGGERVSGDLAAPVRNNVPCPENQDVVSIYRLNINNNIIGEKKTEFQKPPQPDRRSVTAHPPQATLSPPPHVSPPPSPQVEVDPDHPAARMEERFRGGQYRLETPWAGSEYYEAFVAYLARLWSSERAIAESFLIGAKRRPEKNEKANTYWQAFLEREQTELPRCPVCGDRGISSRLDIGHLLGRKERQYVCRCEAGLKAREQLGDSLQSRIYRLTESDYTRLLMSTAGFAS